MAIHFDCPWCTETISVDDSKARARIDCPHCDRPVKVPAKPTHEPPPSLAESSLTSSADTPASRLDSAVSEPPHLDTHSGRDTVCIRSSGRTRAIQDSPGLGNVDARLLKIFALFHARFKRCSNHHVLLQLRRCS